MSHLVPKFRLSTLGELRLTGPGGDLLSGRRKALLLLTYVARRAPGAVARDELATLLWGERDERARHALRRTLLQLRRALGDELEVSHAHVRLSAESIALDARELERALAEERWREAAALCRGDFLPGAEASTGAACRTWVGAEREALRRAGAHALERLSIEGLRQKSAKAQDPYADAYRGLRDALDKPAFSTFMTPGEQRL
jgi:DNA-binding SARP family transcriptional activator